MSDLVPRDRRELVVESMGESDDKRPVGILTQIDLLDLLAGR